MTSNKALVLALCLLAAAPASAASHAAGAERAAEDLVNYENRYTKIGCTAIVVGKGATVDGSTMSTHNADCLNCDFRVARTPSKVHAKGSTKAVLKYKPDYPHFVTDTRSPVWSPANLDEKLPQSAAWADPAFVKSLVVGYIPEAEATYALVEGLFGIMNEAGVGIGESTCASVWFGLPPRACPTCEGPLVDVSALTLVALERCATARCVIETIGGLASELGYYAADVSRDEGGEGLTITDTNEAWMFHILPDKAGTGCVWAAKRVPDDHVAAVANSFVIRDCVKGDPDLLHSPNLWSEAEAAGIWSKKSGVPLDFAAVTRAAPHTPLHRTKTVSILIGALWPSSAFCSFFLG